MTVPTPHFQRSEKDAEGRRNRRLGVLCVLPFYLGELGCCSFDSIRLSVIAMSSMLLLIRFSAEITCHTTNMMMAR